MFYNSPVNHLGLEIFWILVDKYGTIQSVFSYWINWIAGPLQRSVSFHLNFRLVGSIPSLFFLTAARYVLIYHFIPDFGNGKFLLIIVSLLRHLPILLIVFKNQHFTDFLFCSFLFLLSLISVPVIIIAYLLLCSGCILYFLI